MSTPFFNIVVITIIIVYFVLSAAETPRTCGAHTHTHTLGSIWYINSSQYGYVQRDAEAAYDAAGAATR